MWDAVRTEVVSDVSGGAQGDEHLAPINANHLPGRIHHFVKGDDREQPMADVREPVEKIRQASIVWARWLWAASACLVTSPKVETAWKPRSERHWR